MAGENGMMLAGGLHLAIGFFLPGDRRKKAGAFILHYVSIITEKTLWIRREGAEPKTKQKQKGPSMEG